MRVAVIENMAGTLHGQVGVALHEAGALIDVFRPFAGGGLPLDFAAYDAVVVFGGEASALSDDALPYLPALAQAMRAAVEHGTAVLGICLGSQLMARGFGAQNLIGTAREFGWCPVTLTRAGLDDPVLSAAGSAFPSFQWHSDSFTLPEGALQLAQGGVPQQAFRVGRAGYATQFHFEASRAVVGHWAANYGGAMEEMAPGWRTDLARHADRDGAAADAAGLAIARAFVARVAG